MSGILTTKRKRDAVEQVGKFRVSKAGSKVLYGIVVNMDIIREVVPHLIDQINYQ